MYIHFQITDHGKLDCLLLNRCTLRGEFHAWALTSCTRPHSLKALSVGTLHADLTLFQDVLIKIQGVAVRASFETQRRNYCCVSFLYKVAAPYFFLHRLHVTCHSNYLGRPQQFSQLVLVPLQPQRLIQCRLVIKKPKTLCVTSERYFLSFLDINWEDINWDI